MATPVLATKLFIPRPGPNLVLRHRLLTRLNQGLHGRLTLISAPAGFGKTTLVGEWVADCGRPIAWLSLDEGDSDPARFLRYLVAAMQTVAEDVGQSALGALQSPQPPPPESLLTTLLNDLATVPEPFILVLDDYHVIDAPAVDRSLAFLLEHLPPQVHLAITTREDPSFPLARYRARGQLTELRAADLRFTESEAADFLNQMMGLHLAAEDIRALEARTEGWIAGLQMAALALQGALAAPGQQDAADFIHSFTGSHRFVMDYLVEEVLHQQPESVQNFLLCTSILDRLCGPLCDAVVGPFATDATLNGQETLEYLDQANLFIVPLDNERRWYRYHHLFADLLQQRLRQHLAPATGATPVGETEPGVGDYHIRASEWYEENGLEIDAFHHATAAADYARAERLIEGGGMPLHFRGAVAPILHWLESLPAHVLDAWPSLWTVYASTLLVTGQGTRVEEKLQAAEAALQRRDQAAALDDETRDLIGRIAAIRSTLAAGQQQIEAIIAQSRLALEYLHPDNLAFRTSTTWKLGYAYQLRGDDAAASQAYREVISIGQATGNTVFTIVALIGLGSLQEAAAQLRSAAETYQQALDLYGERPLPDAGVAHLGLARIQYEWNDLDAALHHAEQSAQLAQQIENSDRLVASQLFLVRLKLAQADVTGAAALLAKTAQFARQHNFEHRMPEIAAAQVLVLLQQGDLAAATQLVETHELPLSRARLHLVQGDASAALPLLAAVREQAEARGRHHETLHAAVLQAIAHQVHGETEKALPLLGETLAQAEPNGYVRLFVDEGAPMAHLLAQLAPQAAAHGVTPDYIDKLLSLLDAAQPERASASPLTIPAAAQPLIEPLSERELEVLALVAQGLSNRQISERLFLALDTVKGHNRRIFGKLQVKRRTEAVARARELGLV